MNINNIKNYLINVFDKDVQIKGMPAQWQDRLPLFAKMSYSFYLATILDQQITLLEFQQKGKETPMRLKKEADNIAGVLNMPVAFLFDALDPYRRNRLLDLRIAFIVPDKQMYLPFLALSFIERAGVPRPNRDKLSPAGQCLLLYHLQTERLDGLNLQQVSEKLRYSPMTVTRAAQQLDAFGLAKTEGTKDKIFHFALNGRELWEKALPYLISPVKQELYLQQIPDGLRVFKAADNAMEFYSHLLARQDYKAFAAGWDEYRIIRHIIKKPQGVFGAFEGDLLLQIWHYAPDILTQTSIVDPLSLYLSLQDKADEERISQALDEILNYVTWL